MGHRRRAGQGTGHQNVREKTNVEFSNVPTKYRPSADDFLGFASADKPRRSLRDMKKNYGADGADAKIPYSSVESFIKK